MAGFVQEGPRIDDLWTADPLLRSWLDRVLPEDDHNAIVDDVQRFARRVHDEVEPLGAQAEDSPPRLIMRDAWGRAVHRLETHPAWRRLGALAAEEGLVALAYENGHSEAARIHQFAKLHLYGAASAIQSCPLAMTDGAARLLEVHADGHVPDDALARLTSRDPEVAWTSGQWMSEREGGSDVTGATRTAARRHGKSWRLTGEKWFASAADAPMAIALARIDNERPSMFYVRVPSDAAAAGIRLTRLKDKLGTRALPTAEIELHEAEAALIGEPARGVAQIATHFNITRLHNAINAASYMRRAVALAHDYASRRHAFGRPLSDHPLHAETLTDMEAATAACFSLAMHSAALQGRHEANPKDEETALLLRLLTPVVKAYTGKQAVAVVSESMEAIGGLAYMEDSGFPRLLRDAQVLPIWEGTTNILSLDMLRAVRQGALHAWRSSVVASLQPVTHESLKRSAERTRRALARTTESEPDEATARGYTFRIAQVQAAALLLQHAQWCLARGLAGEWHAALARRSCRHLEGDVVFAATAA